MRSNAEQCGAMRSNAKLCGAMQSYAGERISPDTPNLNGSKVQCLGKRCWQLGRRRAGQLRFGCVAYCTYSLS
jgi:hypothetical protein